MANENKQNESLFGKQTRENPEAYLLMVALTMVGFNINIPSARLILKVQENLKKTKGKFDIETAAKIQIANEQYFLDLQNEFNKTDNNGNKTH